jgi:hypothetical protein
MSKPPARVCLRLEYQPHKTMKIAYSDYRAHGTRLLLMGMVNIAALTIEARFLTNLTADHSHSIWLEQTLRENVLPERSSLGQSRGQIQNARLLNDIVYRRVVLCPTSPRRLDIELYRNFGGNPP